MVIGVMLEWLSVGVILVEVVRENFFKEMVFGLIFKLYEGSFYVIIWEKSFLSYGNKFGGFKIGWERRKVESVV